MANFNRVMLMGNLTRDPLLKALPNGMSVCEMGLAVNRYFKTQQGEDKSDVCFLDIECFGKTADNCSRYLRKGSGAFIEGRLKQDKWVDKNSGQNRYKLLVIADKVEFLGSPQQRAQQAGAQQSNPQRSAYDSFGRENVSPFTGQPLPAAAYNPPMPNTVGVQDNASDLPPVESYEDEIIEDDNLPF